MKSENERLPKPEAKRNSAGATPPADDRPADAAERDETFSRDEARRQQERAAEDNLAAPIPIGRAGQIPPD